MTLVVAQGNNVNWVRISQVVRSRTPKQCRERYHQNLKPSLVHDPISEAEGRQIELLVEDIGKRWAEIARRLKGRSDNAVKNWYNGSQNRRKRAALMAQRHANAEHRQQQACAPPADRTDFNNFATAPPSLQVVPRSLPPLPRRPAPPALSPATFHRSYETPLPSPALVSPTDSEMRAPSLMSDAGSYYTTSPRATTTSPVEGHLRLPPLKYLEDTSSDSKLPGVNDLAGALPRLSLNDEHTSPPRSLLTAPNSPVHNLPALRTAGAPGQPPPRPKETRMDVRAFLN